MKQNMLAGVFDMHLHSHPDTAPRKVDDNEASKSIGGARPFEILANNIRTVGVESSVLGSDGGQLKDDYPVELMRSYLRKLSEFGFADKGIVQMAEENPAVY